MTIYLVKRKLIRTSCWCGTPDVVPFLLLLCWYWCCDGDIGVDVVFVSCWCCGIGVGIGAAVTSVWF